MLSAPRSQPHPDLASPARDELTLVEQGDRVECHQWFQVIHTGRIAGVHTLIRDEHDRVWL